MAEMNPKTIPKLKQDNYSDWEFSMRNYLRANKLLGPIDNDAAFIALPPDEQREKKDKAYFYLTLAIGNDYREIATNYNPDTVHNLWILIGNQFEAGVVR